MAASGMRTPRSARQQAVERGRRIQRLAREILEGQGVKVETAPNVVRFLRFKGESAARPVSLRHDFFNIWDFLCVAGPRRFFVQVTTLEGVPDRRLKIRRSGFCATEQDLLLGYKPGRDRHFRVFRGPTFERWDGECWRPAVPEGVEEP